MKPWDLIRIMPAWESERLPRFFLDRSHRFPPGPLHLVVVMGYVPAAAYVTLSAFAYSDLFEGLAVFIIYIGLPVLVLLL
jgi:hypothetical protein